MTLVEEPFAPLTQEEVAEVAATGKTKAPDKTPVMPVPEDAPDCEYKHPRFGRPVSIWAYRDGGGRLLGYDARFEYDDDEGHAKKDVLTLTFCELADGKRGWRAKGFPVPRPLYGLDQLAARPEAPVVIAEGCKSTDAAATLLPDYVALSWPMGGKGVSRANWNALKGRDVLIWPDRDRQRYPETSGTGGSEMPYAEQPGTITAEEIINRLKGTARSIRVLDLDEWDCPPGWDAADALAEGWSPDHTASFVADHAKDVDQAAPGTIMPFNYEYRDDGLYHVPAGDESLRIAGRLKVIAKTRDHAGHSWGLLLEWRDYEGGLHRWSMPMSMLAGDGSEIRVELLSRGLFVSSIPKARSRINEFLGTVDTPLRARAVSKVGWSGQAFALPHLTIGDTAAERVIFQNPEASAHSYEAKGTLEEWQENVAKVAVGNSRLVFMISTALVGPVLQPACEESGGVNVVGSSSTGKTTGMRAAASFWGSPDFIRQWRATSNGLEGVAAQHNETFLALDELSQLDPREAGPTAYMLSNCQGKSRASRTGAGRAVTTWRVMYLSTGEVGLAGLMTDSRQSRTPMAGQEVRILDVPADAGKSMGLFENLHGAASPEAFARQITTAAAEYYGAASLVYLDRLTARRDDVAGAVASTIKEFLKKNVAPGSDGQVLRAARRFGLIAAAGELGIALGILPWDRMEAFDAASVMFRSWIARRGGTGSAEERNIIAQVRAFLEAHGDSRFSSVDVVDSYVGDRGYERNINLRPVINRAGFWKAVKSGADDEHVREYYVLTEAFKEICKGFEPAHVTSVLKGIEALKPASSGKSQQTKRLPDMGPTKVYVIGPEIFDGGE